VDILRQPQEEKNTTLSPVNRCHRPQHQHHGRTFIVRRSCSVSGKIKDLVYYELLKPGDSITGDRYWLQLSRALREKRPEYEQRHDKVILLHDNARPHVAKVVKKYLKTGCFTAPAVLLLLITGCSEGAASHRFFRRNRKLAPKLDRLQRVIFSRWNSKIA